MKTKDVVMQEVDGYTPVYRVYKDRVFRMLFKEKERLLELYNALETKHAYTRRNGTDSQYTGKCHLYENEE